MAARLLMVLTNENGAGTEARKRRRNCGKEGGGGLKRRQQREGIGVGKTRRRLVINGSGQMVWQPSRSYPAVAASQVVVNPAI